jgi:hypothetical protein
MAFHAGIRTARVRLQEKPMATKRTRINPGRGGARFVRRDKQGQFKEVEQVGRSLSQDRKRKAKTRSKPGQGDRGDRK